MFDLPDALEKNARESFFDKLARRTEPAQAATVPARGGGNGCLSQSNATATITREPCWF